MTERRQRMKTKFGNDARDQVRVFNKEGEHFLSYETKIATIRDGEVILYNPYWDMYSSTTNFYLLQFLNETSIRDIREKVAGGEYSVL